jgi:hypothetical protein
MVRTPGSHIPNIKNRSSKHLIPFTKIRPIVRCVSNEQLQKWNNGSYEVTKEIQRRVKLASKRN